VIHTVCCNALADGCLRLWTAGQRIDPTHCNSSFVWRVTSTDTYSDTLSPITYNNWYSGEPNCYNSQEFCMYLLSIRSYAWYDGQCSNKKCSVCELDML